MSAIRDFSQQLALKQLFQIGSTHAFRSLHLPSVRLAGQIGDPLQ
jgi:hypothetical protein